MNTRVLCVDDDPATQLVLGGIIEDAGWRPEAASDATGAREVLAANPDIQVVLLDWMLPDGSGVDLCREFKATAGAARAGAQTREQPGKPAATVHVLPPDQQRRDVAVGRGLPVGARRREGVARLLPRLPLEAVASAWWRVTKT